MARFLFGLGFGLLAERLCERIRPTKRYACGGWMRVNDGPWRYRRSATVLRRPWESRPNTRASAVGSVDMGWMGTVTFQGPMAYPEEGQP